MKALGDYSQYMAPRCDQRCSIYKVGATDAETMAGVRLDHDTPSKCRPGWLALVLIGTPCPTTPTSPKSVGSRAGTHDCRPRFQISRSITPTRRCDSGRNPT